MTVLDDRRQWRKSTYSASQSECVEVCMPGPTVGVRDSKDQGGGQLDVATAAWSALADWLK